MVKIPQVEARGAGHETVWWLAMEALGTGFIGLIKIVGRGVSAPYYWYVNTEWGGRVSGPYGNPKEGKKFLGKK